jgi:hypothetical protein
MVGSSFVSDSEITEWLNQEIAELHTRIDQVSGARFFLSSTTINVLGNDTKEYALPADFWRLVSVRGKLGGTYFRIRNMNEAEVPAMLNAGSMNPGVLYTSAPNVRYRLKGDNLEFLPDKTAFTCTVEYVKAPVRLVNSTDTFDGYAGFEMAPIYGTVAQMLAKEESDPSFYLAQKERIYQHIDAVAGVRDDANPQRVQDVVGYVYYPW